MLAMVSVFAAASVPSAHICNLAGVTNIQLYGFSRSGRFAACAAGRHVSQSHIKSHFWGDEPRFRHFAYFAKAEDDKIGDESSDEDDKPGKAKDTDHVWEQLRQEALEQSEEEPYLASFFYATVLVHPSLERSLAFHLANKLANPTLLSTQLFTLFWETFAEDAGIQEALRSDIKAFRERDPACTSYVHGMLNYKGFLACEAHRIAHRLWGQGRFALALALQNRISEVFQVDIHPGARIGKGVLFDHATGVVIGETAVIGDNVSILHHVTLGGTGNCCGIRHPRIGNGVLIGAAAILLGPIVVGSGAKIGACSLVLIDVPSHTTAVGVPAQILGRGGKAATASVKGELPALSMDHTSLILDYII